MLRNYAKEQGLTLVAGVDEVGWGAFAGPVVTAAVILPADFESELIVDSKKICKSANKMQAAYDLIMKEAVAVGCTAVQASEINSTSPMDALTKCIDDSITELGGLFYPERLLIDGDKYYGKHDIPVDLVKKGDSTFLSIAAASIVAKYRRDAYMVKVHEKYPQYNFAGSKGYYCAKHGQGLIEHGRTRYHRDKYVDTWQKKKGIIV